MDEAHRIEHERIVEQARSQHGDQFAKYVRDGDAAIRCHPDYRLDGSGIEYETAASDMIASILHAYEFSLTPDDIAAGGPFNAEAFALYAVDCYRGDLEDSKTREDEGDGDAA